MDNLHSFSLYSNSFNSIRSVDITVPNILLISIITKLIDRNINAFLILGFGFNFNLILKKIISLYF